jgi:hypothetical protein
MTSQHNEDNQRRKLEGKSYKGTQSLAALIFRSFLANSRLKMREGLKPSGLKEVYALEYCIDSNET